MVLKLDHPADEARAEIEPLFEVGDITYAWGRLRRPGEAVAVQAHVRSMVRSGAELVPRAVRLARDPPIWRVITRAESDTAGHPRARAARRALGLAEELEVAVRSVTE
jgi:hypothetical protein